MTADPLVDQLDAAAHEATQWIHRLATPNPDLADVLDPHGQTALARAVRAWLNGWPPHAVCPHLGSPRASIARLGVPLLSCPTLDCVAALDAAYFAAVPRDRCDACGRPAPGGRFFAEKVQVGPVLLLAELCTACHTEAAPASAEPSAR
jgi:hypothetical protein